MRPPLQQNMPVQALLQRAHDRLRAGAYREAVGLFEQAAEQAPKVPELFNNLGAARRGMGDIQGAVTAYEKAVKLRPAYHAARLNLSRAQLSTGMMEDAVSHAIRVVKAEPNQQPAAVHLADCLARLSFESAGKRSVADCRQALLLLFQRRDINLQRLSGPAVNLLRVSNALPDPETGKGKRDPLLLALLTKTVVADAMFEAWLCAMRSLAVRNATALDTHLLAAMAVQFHLTEFCQPLDVDRNDIAIEGDGLESLLVRSLFRPLSGQNPDEGLISDLRRKARQIEPLAELLRLTIVEPVEEQGLRASIPALTELSDDVSLAVQAQYEESPYPHWRSLDLAPSQTLSERLAGVVPASELVGLENNSPDILIAGCGSGRHAIQTATRISGSSVTAVDLSLASLAYATRSAKTLNIENVRFGHADILELGSLAQRFDLIESSGVLHHMADPLAGWRVLVGLLKPNGLMRIALYSKAARQILEPWRKPADTKDPDSDLRARRQEILSLDHENPARVMTETADFYSMSGCRDLIGHVQEHQFTIPQIADCLNQLSLEFLGFEFPGTATMAAFRARNPDDPSGRNLNAWEAFEDEFPQTFLGMYQFWCRPGR